MKDYLDHIKTTLKEPDTIRTSRWDEDVYLFYRRSGKYFICVVVKMENSTGFVITSYLTDRIKIGEQIWRK